MPLPSVVTPTFELNLISSNKPIKYRPFLVKEEKALLIALESANDKDILNTVKDVLKACIKTRGVKVDNLPSFDLEYLFLNIRGKSIGQSVELSVICSDDNQTKVPLTISLSDIVLNIPDDHTDTIDLGSGLKLKMKYPSLQQFVENNFNVTSKTDKNAIDKAFNSISECIDQVYNSEEAWSASDCTKKEIITFIESLSSMQFSKIEQFFASMPKLSYKTTVVNPNTKVESEVVVEGLSNFFA